MSLYRHLVALIMLYKGGKPIKHLSVLHAQTFCWMFKVQCLCLTFRLVSRGIFFLKSVLEAGNVTRLTLLISGLLQNPVHPTTGMLAVVAALNYCDVVHIAGFGYPSSNKLLHPIHYYGYANMKSMMVGGGHHTCKQFVFL